jgi:hypothetical protein
MWPQIRCGVLPAGVAGAEASGFMLTEQEMSLFNFGWLGGFWPVLFWGGVVALTFVIGQGLRPAA